MMPPPTSEMWHRPSAASSAWSSVMALSLTSSMSLPPKMSGVKMSAAAEKRSPSSADQAMIGPSGAGAPSCGSGARCPSTTSRQAKDIERHHAATRAILCSLCFVLRPRLPEQRGIPEVCGLVWRASYGQAACAEGEEDKVRRARKGKDRGERPNRAHRRVAGAQQWASLARVPVGALRGSPAPDFFMRCPPYDPILVSGMTHRFPGVRVALRAVHLGPFIEFEGRKSSGKNSIIEFWIFRGRIHRVSVTSTHPSPFSP